MSSKISKQRLSVAFVAGMLVAAAVPGVASAAPGECEDSVSGAVLFALDVNGTPIGGPKGTWGWAHPDGKQPTPGQAIQYFCK